jgi:7-cyano-7-deazaguanine synthase in queuosine biosynthesis
VAWHYLDYPQTVYFDVKSRYSAKEIEVVKELIPTTIIDNSLDLHDREQGEKAYIPFRNLLFALQAAKYSNKIIIAGLADDKVSDKNEFAFHSFSIIMSTLERRDISVVSPFWTMTKEDVVKWYENTVGGDKLLKTISCYDPGPERYCGKCPACFRKWVALRSVGYVLDFYNFKLMKKYYYDAQHNAYLPSRNLAILREIDNYPPYWRKDR